MTVPGVPFPLAPSDATPWSVDPDAGRLTVTAGPRTDIFVDPAAARGAEAAGTLNAPRLLGRPPEGDFRLSARVGVAFASTFDAGVLLLWHDERHWAKLCFEYSPDGEPMVVSVVNREVSDDANGPVVSGRSVWLRVSRTGGVLGYHASSDGQRWQLVRLFALDAPPDAALTVGFEGQSPTGEGCVATFEDITFLTTGLADPRDGS
ncbi:MULTISPECIES: DUF1349 domain-containing protein [Streptomyces]|uniref:DUF1349 domain-containing protein n=1 Tax=Streptomyces TaxID=1883 RepID=UPI00386AD2AA